MSPLMGEAIGTAASVMLGTAATCRMRLGGGDGSWHALTMSMAWVGATFAGLLIAASSGAGHLNPAVTLGLYAGGHFPGDRVQPFMLAQCLGAFLGAALMWLSCLPLWGQARGDRRTIDCFCVQPAVRAPLGILLVEVVGTMLLVAGFLALRKACAADPTTSVVEGRGIMLWAIGGAALTLSLGLSLAGGWGVALNPARDLGPRLAHTLLPLPGKGSSAWWEAWPAVVGPLVGAWIAGALSRTVA